MSNLNLKNKLKHCVYGSQACISKLHLSVE